MYSEFYGLKENPFRLTPDPAFLYMTAHHREALSGLVYSACNRAGLTVLIGEAGTGKTTLLNALRGWLDNRQFVVGVFSNPTLNRAEFFDALLLQFGVPCSSPLKSRQLAALSEALAKRRSEGRRSVLIVDEAQRLSLELLEEIRLLLNLETTTEKLLEIIIAGQPELRDILRQPELRQLKQRVSCFCRLEPLTRQEVGEYLQHRLAQAGLPKQELFAADTIDLIAEYSHGIPRVISSLCDVALQTGFALQSRTITRAIVQEAAVDLDLAAPVPPPLPHTAVVAALRTVPSPVTAMPTLVRPANSHVGEPHRPPMPLESYASRQGSLGFFAGLIERWK